MNSVMQGTHKALGRWRQTHWPGDFHNTTVMRDWVNAATTQPPQCLLVLLVLQEVKSVGAVVIRLEKRTPGSTGGPTVRAANCGKHAVKVFLVPRRSFLPARPEMNRPAPDTHQFGNLVPGQTTSPTQFVNCRLVHAAAARRHTEDFGELFRVDMGL